MMTSVKTSVIELLLVDETNMAPIVSEVTTHLYALVFIGDLVEESAFNLVTRLVLKMNLFSADLIHPPIVQLILHVINETVHVSTDTLTNPAAHKIVGRKLLGYYLS